MIKLCAFVLAVMLLAGCGGGTGNSQTGGAVDSAPALRKMDLQNAAPVKLTPDNAPELLSLAQLYLPADLQLSRYDYQRILERSGSQSERCRDGGRITVTSIPRESRVRFDFGECREDATMLDGELNVILYKIDTLGADGYFYARDFRISAGGVTLQYNYDITLKTTNPQDTHTIKQQWHYDVEVVYVQSAEVLRYVLDIEENGDKALLRGTYLLPDNTYFQISSHNLKASYLPLFGARDEHFFDPFLSNDDAQIRLQGDNSHLIYTYVKGYEPFYDLTLDEQRNEKILSYAKQIKWEDNTTAMGLNEYRPYLKGMALSGEEYDHDAFYNDTIVHFYAYQKENNLTVRLRDERSDYPYYDISLKLIEKPVTSKLSVDSVFPVEQEIDFSNQDMYDRYIMISFDIDFDAEGMYMFEMVIKDGEYTVSKKISIEYYDPNLPVTMKKLDFPVVQAYYIPKLKRMAYLTILPFNRLILDDLHGDRTFFALDDIGWDVDLDDTGTKLVVAEEHGIEVIDISDFPSLYREQSYRYDKNVSFNKIKVIGAYAYIGVLPLQFGGDELYRINLDNGEIIESDSLGFSWYTLITNGDKSLLYTISALSDYQIYMGIDTDEPKQIESFTTDDFRDFVINNYLFDPAAALYDPDHIILRNGAIYRLGTVAAPKLTRTGMIRYLTPEDSHVYSTYPNGSAEKSFVYFDASDTKYTVVNTLDSEYTRDGITTFYETSMFGEDTLNIFSKKDQKLLYQRILKKYFRDSNGDLVRLKVRQIRFLSDDQLFILYRGYKHVSKVGEMPEDVDVGYDFYEIQKI